jgi:hypothetical protein
MTALTEFLRKGRIILGRQIMEDFLECSDSQLYNCLNIWRGYFGQRGPGSSVGRATGYGLEGPVIEFWWGRYYPHLSRPTLGPATGSFHGVEIGGGVTPTLHSVLVPKSNTRVEL